jgi:hypothetical protein
MGAHANADDRDLGDIGIVRQLAITDLRRGLLD